MSDSMESTSSGWSSFVLILAAIIPLTLFWKPFRHLINEYRLYRRCQQYPHIVVCKDNSSAATSERMNHGIVGRITQIVVWLFDTVVSFLGLVMNKLITALISKIDEKEATTTEPDATQHTNSTETIEPTMSYSYTESQVESSSPRPYYHSTTSDEMNHGAIVRRNELVQQNFSAQVPSEEIFEAPPQNKGKAELRKRKGLDSMTSKSMFPQRIYELDRRRNTTIYSRPSVQQSQTQMVTTTSTLPLVIDSSSLSEKMRKRRLNGQRIMGHDAILGEGDEGTSRKRRKLNVGRMPLQGCAVRHPRVGGWHSTKILDRREREEREERLLRGMNRKRAKPAVEISKAAASTATSTAASVSSTPAFTFGQAPAATSTNSIAPTGKQEATATASTPAPAFQFGATGSSGSEKKAEPASKAPAFSFGSKSTSSTTNSVSTAKTSQAAPAPVTFQFGTSSGGTSGDTKTKDQSTDQAPPTFGNATSSTTNSAPPSSGTAPSASSQPAPVFGASTNISASSTSVVPPPVFGASSVAPAQAPAAPAAPATTPTVPGFGGKPTATTSAPGPSGFGAPAPAAQGFGATTAPPPTFGAPSAASTTSSQPGKPANAPALTFGNTKENTNPGGFNSSFQAPAPSNGFLKPQVANTAAPSFGGMPGFSAGAAPASGASARRMARRARSRRR